MGKPLALLLLLGANLLWSSTNVVAKIAFGALTPLQVSAGRMIVAGLVALPWLARYQARRALPARAWPKVAAVGLVGFALSKFLYLWGLNLTTATDTSLLIAVEPLFTIALGAAVLGEALTRRRLAAFAVGALGAYLLIARGLRPPSLAAAHVVGDLVVMLSLTCEAALSVLGKSLVRRFPAAQVTSAAFVAALCVWLPLALVDGLATGWPPLQAGPVAAIVYLALGCTVLPYWAWFRALEELDAGVVALSLFAQPLAGALLALLLLGEPLHAATVAGGALVLFSLYLALGLPLRPARPGRRG